MRKLLLFPLFVFCQYAFCQDTSGDANNIAKNKAIDTYNKIINVQSGLYNGVEYNGYISGIDGHPFYVSMNWVQGSVFYDGTLYTDVPLKFDMLNEKLIVKRFDGFAIELLNEKLDYFTVGTHLFKHLFNNSALPAGYYQELYVGNPGIYAKKTKVIKETLNENNFNQKFEENEKYYAINDAHVVVVKNLKSIFDLMKDKSKNAQQYLKQSNISFNKHPEEAMIKIAEYYNRANK